MNIDCRVQYQRTSYSLNVDIQQRQIFLHLPLGWGRAWQLRNQGVSDELYQIYFRKAIQLTQLFALCQNKYFILINQRLLSQQSNIDIPEQYQRLRQAFYRFNERDVKSRVIENSIGYHFVLTPWRTPTVTWVNCVCNLKAVHPETANKQTAKTSLTTGEKLRCRQMHNRQNIDK